MVSKEDANVGKRLRPGELISDRRAYRECKGMVTTRDI